MSTVEFFNQFNKQTQTLNNFAYSLTRDAEDAKDLYQETAFRALSNRDKFQPGTNFKAWLITIMKNIFINNYRRKVKGGIVNDNSENQYYFNSISNSVLNRAESDMMMKELHAMVDSLDDSLKVPFVRYYHGYKYQEIADELHLPLGTVKSRIFFARKALKSMIGSQYHIHQEMHQEMAVSDN
ncbi:MAG: RNA polymerase sigma factor [Saprospiraceae bacterium]|jgi:RNA polymerase sigma-70 factor (ECF subfamily)|nr:RNA polymerase sigma factor [Saprospiraceae bacterium]MBK7796135.1 RNA polymerase sigma factor [Saprospiraceae bacterium]MBK8151693.1 RNA polymerase sigma factor [Saprospiraceae bacterium]MBL0261220.1 RNA polymerase sigma factor [Saprospiraceae bacterium]MBX7162277.1 RNA polymerase sigma factor [Saprospiraceae bacterium]